MLRGELKGALCASQNHLNIKENIKKTKKGTIYKRRLDYLQGIRKITLEFERTLNYRCY